MASGSAHAPDPCPTTTTNGIAAAAVLALPASSPSMLQKWKMQMTHSFRKWKYLKQNEILVGMRKIYVGIKSCSKERSFCYRFFFFFLTLLWFTNEDMLGKKKSKNIKGGTYVKVKNIAWHTWVFEFCVTYYTALCCWSNYLSFLNPFPCV